MHTTAAAWRDICASAPPAAVMDRPNTRAARPQHPKLKLSLKVHVAGRQRRSRLVAGGATTPLEPAPIGRFPAASRPLALVHSIQCMFDQGEVTSLAEVAELGHMTRARSAQTMSLSLLAPTPERTSLSLRAPRKATIPLPSTVCGKLPRIPRSEAATNAT